MGCKNTKPKEGIPQRVNTGTLPYSVSSLKTNDSSGLKRKLQRLNDLK